MPPGGDFPGNGDPVPYPRFDNGAEVTGGPGDTRIVFLSVPESLRGQIDTGHDHREHGGGEPDHDDEDGHDHDGENDAARFEIDPSIPIPAEIPPGEQKLNTESLTWEMILAGMLKIIRSAHEGSSLAAGIEAGDIDYYRHFVLVLRPDILDEFTGAALVQARNGNYGNALEILSVLRGLFPASPLPPQHYALVLEDEAERLEDSGREEEAAPRWQAAHEIWKTLLARNPPWPDAFFNAGFFYMKTRDFSRARECFSGYLRLAEDEKKKQRAEKIVREITEKNLDDEMFREAYDFIRTGQEEKGMERLRDFLERHSAVWNGWFLLGWALRRLGRWADGEAAFRKAVELGGANSDTLNELAICLMEQGNYPAARRELEKALREEPENVKIISNLGFLALKTGNPDEAAGFFRTVLEIDPGDPIARQYLPDDA